ncbi:MAG: hypothetical protein COU33_05235 [Candidatus Magasanikbacteria bacterium CG10_big_fil_rev_8_21_14_0_10_43_6]|uniref:Uncharacterized protein n=1 Tax=Candidatus Magasanikbacteria bacterium CG10_big_fil_rev_8_21_14_0_10_43_6 TaxID=1974650 RepID=A0A2M6VZT4_9BACT|nr:MAG: hypothetical protein COU33_05235 [Candidatus Magasanikbacteria bacterium CG10_big_fil_rev_8_21_14_0_10_43_6]
MKLFHHTHHFFGHVHQKKVRHRVAVLVASYLFLIGMTSAIGIYFGMDGFAVFPLVILFILVGLITHIAIDHY